MGIVSQYVYRGPDTGRSKMVFSLCLDSVLVSKLPLNKLYQSFKFRLSKNFCRARQTSETNSIVLIGVSNRLLAVMLLNPHYCSR